MNTRARNPISVMKIGWDFLTKREGPLTMAPSQLGIFESTTDDPFANVEYHVQPLSLVREEEKSCLSL